MKPRRWRLWLFGALSGMAMGWLAAEAESLFIISSGGSMRLSLSESTKTFGAALTLYVPVFAFVGVLNALLIGALASRRRSAFLPVLISLWVFEGLCAYGGRWIDENLLGSWPLLSPVSLRAFLLLVLGSAVACAGLAWMLIRVSRSPLGNKRALWGIAGIGLFLLMVAPIPLLVLGNWDLPPVPTAAPPAGSPSVVLITVDTLRADHLSPYGRRLGKTEAWSALAADGVLFDNAFCQIPGTLPSHCTLLTGMYVGQHGVVRNGMHYSGRYPTLAEMFKKNGYSTAAFVGSSVLNARFGLARGFEIYSDSFFRPFGLRVPGASDLLLAKSVARLLYGQYAYESRSSEEVNEDAIAWLKEAGDRPFFLWVHYWDPHTPYDPPPPYKGRYYEGNPLSPHHRSMEEVSFPPEKRGYMEGWLRGVTDVDYPIAQYMGEVDYVDDCIGGLLSALKDRGLYDGSVVVLTADHGECLGERGIWFEHKDVYEPTARVPLVIKTAGGGSGGSRVSSIVEGVDVSPTVLQLAGLPVPERLAGRSLFPFPQNGKGASKRWAVLGSGEVRGLRGHRWKYISRKGGDKELYDLTSDRTEEVNVASKHRSEVERFEAVLRKLEGEGLFKDPPSGNLNGRTAEMLRALGYVQ